jgi:peroxiredoxin Q/BCP
MSIPVAGTRAPDFTLASNTGEVIHLTDLQGKRMVLCFFPGSGAGCVIETSGFRDNWPELQAENITVIGINRNSVKENQKFANKYGLPFQLLSDEDGTVSKQYGVWIERRMYGSKYMSISRTTFYIRPNGMIGHVWQQVRPEGHAQNVLVYLRKV